MVKNLTKFKRFESFKQINENNIIPTGTVFGNLVTTGSFDIRTFGIKKRKTRRFYECKCVCGKIKWYQSHKLKFDNIIHCGCLNVKQPKPTKIISTVNLIPPGTRYNKLICKEYLFTKVNKGIYKKLYRWKCDCGKEKDILATSVIQGDTKSCGCLQREAMQKIHQSKKYILLPEQIVANSIHTNYKHAAIRRDLVFKLSTKDVENFIFSNCYYCGIIPLNVRIIRQNIEVLYNGIDRKDNNEGYTVYNCVTCCKFCNLGKTNSSYSEWISHLDNLVKYRSSLDETKGS